MGSFDLKNVPSCPFEGRRVVLLSGVDELSTLSVSYIRINYPEIALLEECVYFAEWNLEETPSAALDTLSRVGFFPWIEASREFDQALNQAILCHYKSVFDHLRRALELVVIGAFFTSEASSPKDARGWLESDRETPLFSKTLQQLLALPRFSALDSTTVWSKTLKEFYWELCDVIHVRGRLASFEEIQPSFLHLGGKCVPHFSSKSLHRCLDYFVATVRHSATIVALTNPVLLVGVPVDDKFGLNPPASGLFNEGQADRLTELVLPETRSFFKDLVTRDPEVISMTSWVLSLPDLTEEEFALQAEDMNRTLRRKES